jgi:hypothetical protein
MIVAGTNGPNEFRKSWANRGRCAQKTSKWGPNGPVRCTGAGVKLTDEAAKPKMRTEDT